MVENKILQKSIQHYQETGCWSGELHEQVVEILNGVIDKYCFADKTDAFQDGFVLMMGACKLAKTDKNCFAFLNACLINMIHQNHRHAKVEEKYLKEYGDR